MLVWMNIWINFIELTSLTTYLVSDFYCLFLQSTGHQLLHMSCYLLVHYYGNKNLEYFPHSPALAFFQ